MVTKSQLAGMAAKIESLAGALEGGPVRVTVFRGETEESSGPITPGAKCASSIGCMWSATHAMNISPRHYQAAKTSSSCVSS